MEPMIHPMKKYCLPLILGLFVLSSCSSPSTSGAFYSKYKHTQGVQNMKVPGWVIWMGSGIARPFVKDKEVRAGMRLAKKVKKLRFLMAEDANPIPYADVQNFVGNLRNNNYDDLIYVKEQGMMVTIMAKDNKEKIKDLLVLVHEEDEFVFFSAKTNIKYDDLSDMIQTFLQDVKEQEEMEQLSKAERKKRRKEKKEKDTRPQA